MTTASAVHRRDHIADPVHEIENRSFGSGLRIPLNSLALSAG